MLKTLKRKLSIFFIGTTTFFFTIIMGLMLYILVQNDQSNLHLMNTNKLDYIIYDLDEGHETYSLEDLRNKYSISIIPIEAANEVITEEESPTEEFVVSYRMSSNNSAYIVASGNDNESITYSIKFEDGNYQNATLIKNLIIILGIYVLGIVCIILLCRVFVRTALGPLEETLLRQNEFISSVSHEFRNPLAVIQDSTSLVKSVYQEELGDDIKYLNNISDECNGLSKLLNTMFSYISFNQKTIDSHRELIKFEDFLIDIYPLLTEKCHSKEIQLDINLPDEYVLPEIAINKSQMTEFFINLVDNAVSFSPAKSTITIKTYLKKNAMFVEVVDEGMGISKADKRMAFEAFYCGDKSRNDKDHFGLGLAIAKDIADNHHAKIRLLDAPGGGCLIQIIFSLNGKS